MAGCTRFYYSTSDGCNLIIGSAVPIGEDASITSSGFLDSACVGDSLNNGLRKVTSFYRGFATSLEADDLIESMTSSNGARQDWRGGVFNEWVNHFNETNSRSRSSYMHLVSAQANFTEPDDAVYTWILFQVITYTRSSRVNRRRRNSGTIP